MIRTIGFDRIFKLFRAHSAAFIVFAALLSCSESTGPYDGEVTVTRSIRSDGLVLQEFHYPEWMRHPSDESAPVSSIRSAARQSNLMGTSTATAAVTALPMYNVTTVPFAPEAAPTANRGPTVSNSLLSNVPLGFSFTFYGTSYSAINIGANGIVGFAGTKMTDGCCNARFIARNDVFNNIIALGWSAWIVPTANAIRYETRGAAPNRRFVLQFTNLLEDGGSGTMTVQLVLFERTNEIVLHTTNLSVSKHVLTQGIENLPASEAAGFAGRDSTRFVLANDAVKFSPAAVNVAPTITAPADLSINTSPSACVATVDIGTPTVKDDSQDAPAISWVRSDGATDLNAAYQRGITTITWTALDVEGLKGVATQTVTVSDKEKPIVTAPADISMRAAPRIFGAAVNPGTATATDNCQPPSVIGRRGDNLPLDAGYPVGTTTITWTATDASGNTGTATQRVTVTGNVPPVIKLPASMSANTDARVCSAVVNVGAATATDDAEGVVVSWVRSDGASLLDAPYAKGITTIKWTATDADNATASGTQTITVLDNERPSIAAPADIAVNNAAGASSASVSVGSATAEDNCKDVSVGGARSDGAALSAPYPVGSTKITWTATDASGNAMSAIQNVTVSDNEAPVIFMPASYTVNATSPSGAVVKYSYSATDNVGVVSADCTPASGSTLPIGVNTISCGAVDAAGNRTTRSFTVTVLGAHDQIADLIKYVTGLNLPNGLSQPLLAQLETAYRDPGSNTPHVSCIKMGDFITMVARNQAALGQYAASMTADATRIRNVLGCQ